MIEAEPAFRCPLPVCVIGNDKSAFACPFMFPFIVSLAVKVPTTELGTQNKIPTVELVIFISPIIATSVATAIIGDIDIKNYTAGIFFWVPSSVVGTFTANETINGNINGQAKADLSFPITQTGRGHLNAGSASIIVEGVTMPYEIHFIDNAKNNGQLVLLRAQN